MRSMGGARLALRPWALTGGPQRRVLFFGKNMSRTRCTGALAEAFRDHGSVVRWVNVTTLRRWLGEKAARSRVCSIWRRFRPDLVVVFLRDLPRDLLVEISREVPVVQWVEDALENLEEFHVDYMRLARLVCVTNPGNISALQARGVGDVLSTMSGFSPTFHFPAPLRDPSRDVAFIGGPGTSGHRGRFVARLSAHFHVEVYGREWAEAQRLYRTLRVRGCVKPRGYREVCAASAIVLGLNEINDAPYYFSNRTWLSLACRAFHLTSYVPGLEEIFGNHEHLVWFRSTDECLDLVRHYLSRPAERRRIAECGYRFALSRHRYFDRVAAIFAHLDLESGSRRVAEPSIPATGSERLSAHIAE